MSLPLRLSRERIVLYGLLLAIVASSPFLLFPSWFRDVAFRGDFANFWSAGANAGSAILLDFRALGVWQSAHAIVPQAFVYPPAFAWFYAPFAHLSPVAGMVLEDGLMLALFAAAGLLAARIYALPRWFALVAVFAWGPALSSVELGQNTALALLLVLAAVGALALRRDLLAGLAIGVLLYKPSIALPFVVLLLVRREWRGLAVVAACAAGWYLASAIATGGDWAWPRTYVQLIAGTNVGEFSGNAYKAYTIPTLLLALGVPALWAYGAALVAFAGGMAMLARAPALEAASIAPLIGLAASPHSWPYEAVLLLPAVFYAMLCLREPLRTRAVCAAYLVAALALVVPHAGHALALLSVGGAAWWVGSTLAASS